MQKINPCPPPQKSIKSPHGICRVYIIKNPFTWCAWLQRREIPLRPLQKQHICFQKTYMATGTDLCRRRAQLSLRIQLGPFSPLGSGCCSWNLGWVLRRLWLPVVEGIPSHYWLLRSHGKLLPWRSPLVLLNWAFAEGLVWRDSISRWEREGRSDVMWTVDIPRGKNMGNDNESCTQREGGPWQAYRKTHMWLLLAWSPDPAMQWDTGLISMSTYPRLGPHSAGRGNSG